MDLCEQIYNFFNSPFFVIWGGISIIVTIYIAIRTFILIFKGVIPVWYRLGKGLSKRKIAVFAENQEYSELKSLLTDSGLFSEKNIIRIDKNSIKKAKGFTLLLVHHFSFKNNLEEIINLKMDEAALIIYAPQSEGMIDGGMIQKINDHRNSIIVNMRGRLLNDILTSMMTTGYGKR
jgi:hypothetical protein